MKLRPQEAVELLLNNDVVAIPTETVYGLAGRISSPEALKKIFAVKERPSFDPLIVHISDVAQLKDVVTNFPPSAKILADAFWPGPLTMVLPKTKNLSPLITSGLEHVAVRMPDHPMTLEILEKVGPVAAPSANLFGKTSPTQADHVESEFQGRVGVVDGGPCSVGIESTVIKIQENENNVDILILRPGLVSEKDITGALKDIKQWVTVELGTSKDSPGQLENHYQPGRPLVIADADIDWSPTLHEDVCKHLKLIEAAKPALWTFSDTPPEVVARMLYQQMREKTLSAPENSYIFLSLPKGYYRPQWTALRDRIDKASFLKIKLIERKPSIFVKNSRPEEE